MNFASTRLFIISMLLALTNPCLAQVDRLVSKGAPDVWVESMDVAPPKVIPTEMKNLSAVDEYWKTEVLVAGRQSQRFERRITTIQNASGLQELGTVQIGFIQDFQSVKVHVLKVHRDGNVQDILPKTTFRITQMQASTRDANLTGRVQALAQIDDLRLGDRVELAYTVSGENAVFGDSYSALILWNSDRRSYNREARILSPLSQPVEHKLVGLHLPQVEVKRQNLGDMQELRVSQARVLPVLLEDAMPRNIVVGTYLQITSFKSWAEVQAWGSALFAASQVHPSVRNLAQRFKDEANAQADGRADSSNYLSNVQPPALRKRYLALVKAIQFVQEDVRYFSVALAENTHRPQLPHVTLERRYGDCKDKTMLLAALLSELGISSTPVLLNSQETWRVHRYAPAPTVFDHVVLRVEVPLEVPSETAANLSGNKSLLLYVDATRRIEGIPFFSQSDAWRGSLGLALGRSNATQGGLELMGRRTPEPSVVVSEKVLASALEGEAQFEIDTRYFARTAEASRFIDAQRGTEARRRWLVGAFARRHADSSTQNNYPQIISNPISNTYTLVERYKIGKLLSRDSQHNVWTASFAARQLLSALVDTPPSKNRFYPVAINSPYTINRYALEVHMPSGIEGHEDPATDKLETPHFKLETQRSFRGKVFRFQASLTILREAVGNPPILNNSVK